MLYGPIGGTSSIYYLILCYRKHVNRTTGSIAWKMWTERLYSLSFCVVPFFCVNVLHPERFSWYSSFCFIQSGKKKFFQIRGNNLSQESKTFLFQKSVLLSCDSDVLHVCGGGYFFHTSVSWKKRDGGYIWELLYSMTVLSIKDMRDIAESENGFYLFIAMLVLRLISCVVYF